MQSQEARYQPQLVNKTLKPPRPTKSSLIRSKSNSVNRKLESLHINAENEK